MRVSVAIPSWNGWPMLQRNLPAVLAACERQGNAEVVVCDDGSTDGTPDLLRAQFPAVRTVTRAANGGFGAAANDAVRAAAGRIVVCLNNDVRPEPGFLAPLIAALEHDPTLFAVSPRMLNARFGGDEARSRLTFRRGLLDLTFPHRAGPPPESAPAPIPYACGGAAALRRDRFLDLGGFDPLYHPFYWEDVDLGWRAWRRGWGSLHIPEARVHHDGGGTIGARFHARAVKVAYERNRLLFHWSNLLDARLWSRHLGWIGPRAAWATARATPFATGLRLALASRGAALERRHRESDAARLSDGEILARCGGVG